MYLSRHVPLYKSGRPRDFEIGDNVSTVARSLDRVEKSASQTTASLSLTLASSIERRAETLPSETAVSSAFDSCWRLVGATKMILGRVSVHRNHFNITVAKQ